jgi:Leucine-rich repeat (LRR) protein
MSSSEDDDDDDSTAIPAEDEHGEGDAVSGTGQLDDDAGQPNERHQDVPLPESGDSHITNKEEDAQRHQVKEKTALPPRIAAARRDYALNKKLRAEESNTQAVANNAAAACTPTSVPRISAPIVKGGLHKRSFLRNDPREQQVVPKAGVGTHTNSTNRMAMTPLRGLRKNRNAQPDSTSTREQEWNQGSMRENAQTTLLEEQNDESIISDQLDENAPDNQEGRSISPRVEEDVSSHELESTSRVSELNQGSVREHTQMTLMEEELDQSILPDQFDENAPNNQEGRPTSAPVNEDVSSQEELVQAVLVQEDSNSQLEVVGEAQEVDPEMLVAQANRRKEQREKQYQRYGVTGVLLLCVALATSLGLVFRRQNNTTATTIQSSSKAPTTSPSQSPTAAPSEVPSSVVDAFVETLPNYTLPDFQNASAPEVKAIDWLETHPNFSNMTEFRKKQLYALASFYYAFHGPKWPNLWNKDWLDVYRSECEWHSAGYGYVETWDSGAFQEDDSQFAVNSSCNNEGQFTTLYLTSLELSGSRPTLPPALAFLTALERIDLRLNNFQGSFSPGFIPPSLWANLPSLQVLSLFINDFTGTIPSDIGLLKRLTHLDLLDNSLSGTLPHSIGNLSQLEYLDLRSNVLSGSLPSELGLLTALRSLHLDRNVLLSQNLPSEIGFMTSLIALSLTENLFSGWIPTEIGLLSGMTSLNFLGNAFSGNVPSEIGFMTALERLDLQDNHRLSGTVPMELTLLARNYSLMDVDLRKTQVSGTIPSDLCSVTNFDCSDYLCGCDCPCNWSVVESSETWDLFDLEECEIDLTTTAGYCIKSHTAAGNSTSVYGSNVYCRFKVKKSGNLSVPVFGTESGFDLLWVGGIKYSGNKGPEGVVVEAGEILIWQSDDSNGQDGFIICLDAY